MDVVLLSPHLLRVRRQCKGLDLNGLVSDKQCKSNNPRSTMPKRKIDDTTIDPVSPAVKRKCGQPKQLVELHCDVLESIFKWVELTDRASLAAISPAFAEIILTRVSCASCDVLPRNYSQSPTSASNSGHPVDRTHPAAQPGPG